MRDMLCTCGRTGECRACKEFDALPASTQPSSPPPEVEDCERCGGGSISDEDRDELGRLREQNRLARREVEQRDSLIDRLHAEARHDREGTGKQPQPEPQGDAVEALAVEMALDKALPVNDVIRDEARRYLATITPLLHRDLRERLACEDTKHAVFQEAVKHMSFESPEHQEEYVWQLVDGVIGTILAALDKEDSDD